MPQDKDDNVRSALDDILNIEADRVKAEDEARRKRDEEARRAKEEAERKAREDEARRIREEQQRIADEARRIREEESRKLHTRQLEEMRVQQETNHKARLVEEEMRLRHEKDLAVLDAQKKKIPVWLWAVIGAIVIGAGVTGTILYMNYQDAQAEKAATAQKAERERQEREKQLAAEREKLRRLELELEANRRAQADADQKITALMEQITQAQGNAEAMAALQAQLAKAQEEKQSLIDAGSAIKKGGRPGRPGSSGTSAPVTKTRKCINQGTPLEECFMCPGDPRC